jgi:hypothetical protein
MMSLEFRGIAIRYGSCLERYIAVPRHPDTYQFWDRENDHSKRGARAGLVVAADRAAVPENPDPTVKKSACQVCSRELRPIATL